MKHQVEIEMGFYRSKRWTMVIEQPLDGMTDHAMALRALRAEALALEAFVKAALERHVGGLTR